LPVTVRLVDAGFTYVFRIDSGDAGNLLLNIVVIIHLFWYKENVVIITRKSPMP